MPSKFVHTANELMALFFYGIFYVLHSPILLVTGLAQGRRGPVVFVCCAALIVLHGFLLHATPIWEARTALHEVYAATLLETAETPPVGTNDDRWLAFSERLDSNSLKHGFSSWLELNATALDLLGRDEYERSMEALSIVPGEREP